MPYRSRIPQIEAALERGIDEGAWQAATYVADLAEQLAPKKTGDLASTGRVEPERGAGAGVYRVAFGGKAGRKTGRLVTYAAIVEDDQPFLRPATQQINVKEEVIKAVKAALGGIL